MTTAPPVPAIEEPGPEYRRGVGVMLLNRDGLAFAAERIDTPDAWQMPQGGIDRDEDPYAAAMRELEEETGVRTTAFLAETPGWLRYDLPMDLRKKIWKGRYIGQAQKWYALRFDGDEQEIDISGDHAEFSAWKWIRPQWLPTLIVGFKRPLYKAVLKEFLPVIARLSG